MKHLLAISLCTLLAACAAPKDPAFATTGATITYEGHWGIADELPSGMSNGSVASQHWGYLRVYPVLTPPLACNVEPQPDGTVLLTPCKGKGEQVALPQTMY